MAQNQQYSFYELLHRRCVPLGLAQYGVISPSDVSRALAGAALCSHVTAIAWFKTVTNAWTTSYRMHESVKFSCVFGCNAEDKLEHYLKCHTLWSILDEAFGGNLTPCPFSRVNFDKPSCKQYILIESAFEIYHALKIGQRTLVEECIASGRFAPCIAVATILASDRARSAAGLIRERACNVLAVADCL